MRNSIKIWYDIKYILGNQPTFPSYENSFKTKVETQAVSFIKIKAGLMNRPSRKHFCFDNELGKHKVYVNDFEISNKLVTNKEYLDFIRLEGIKTLILA
jgi:formylglycine-generating enzyme required for sulfatase activity